MLADGCSHGSMDAARKCQSMALFHWLGHGAWRLRHSTTGMLASRILWFAIGALGPQLLALARSLELSSTAACVQHKAA